MGIGLSVIEICMKTYFSTYTLSKTKFSGFSGLKQTVDPIAMKHDAHLPHIEIKLKEETEWESDSRLSRYA